MDQVETGLPANRFSNRRFTDVKILIKAGDKRLDLIDSKLTDEVDIHCGSSGSVKRTRHAASDVVANLQLAKRGNNRREGSDKVIEFVQRSISPDFDT